MAVNNSYSLLIIFIIFALLHKLIALVNLLKIPVSKIRYVMNIIEPIFICYFFLFTKLNTYLKNLFYLFLLAPINYWLCDQGLIYYFIDKNKKNTIIVNNVEFYGDLVINIVVLLYTVYFINQLFLN
jgi:hypothetical protein